MNTIFRFIIAGVLFGLSSLNAQNDSIKANAIKAKVELDTAKVKTVVYKKSEDSINKSILKDYKTKLKKTEAQRRSDSIKVASLEARILTLSTTDEIERKNLENQLKELNSRDEKRLAAKKKEINALRENAIAYPVYGFFKDTLFIIHSNIGHFPAKDRAIAMTKRIKGLGSVYKFKKESLEIVNTEITADIMNGESFIVSLSDDDAIWENTTKNELAETYKTIIGNAVINYQAETSFKQLSTEIGQAILVLIIIFILFYLLRRLFKWTANKIHSEEGKSLKGLKIRHYTLFDAHRLVNVMLLLNKALKWFCILLLMYITLPILFGIFPWTKNLGQTLFGYILTPAKRILNSIWDYLPNLITIIIIVYIFKYVMKLFYFLKEETRRKRLKLPGFYPEWATPTYQIIKVLTYAFMLVVIFPYLPFSDSPIFQGVSVFLGVIFSFGSSGSLSNLIAGIILTYMRLFKIGDRIKIGDIIGDVIEKSPLITRIKTSKNVIISIPNTTVMNSHTINYSSDETYSTLILHTTVTIGYDVPWKEVHKALIIAAERTELILDKPKPFVLQTSLDDNYVSYQINGYTKSANHQADIYSNLHANIQDSCNEAGIEILSPHYRAARDGNASAIPANYLSKDYKAPHFNVNINKES